MWEFIGNVIEAVLSIWFADSQMRDSSPITAGSKFDRDSRRFVARLCAGIVLLLVLAGLLWWYFS